MSTGYTINSSHWFGPGNINDLQSLPALNKVLLEGIPDGERICALMRMKEYGLILKIAKQHGGWNSVWNVWNLFKGACNSAERQLHRQVNTRKVFSRLVPVRLIRQGEYCMAYLSKDPVLKVMPMAAFSIRIESIISGPICEKADVAVALCYAQLESALHFMHRGEFHDYDNMASAWTAEQLLSRSQSRRLSTEFVLRKDEPCIDVANCTAINFLGKYVRELESYALRIVRALDDDNGRSQRLISEGANPDSVCDGQLIYQKGREYDHLKRHTRQIRATIEILVGRYDKAWPVCGRDTGRTKRRRNKPDYDQVKSFVRSMYPGADSSLPALTDALSKRKISKARPFPTDEEIEADLRESNEQDRKDEEQSERGLERSRLSLQWREDPVVERAMPSQDASQTRQMTDDIERDLAEASAYDERLEEERMAGRARNEERKKWKIAARDGEDQDLDR